MPLLNSGALFRSNCLSRRQYAKKVPFGIKGLGQRQPATMSMVKNKTNAILIRDIFSIHWILEVFEILRSRIFDCSISTILSVFFLSQGQCDAYAIVLIGRCISLFVVIEKKLIRSTTYVLSTY